VSALAEKVAQHALARLEMFYPTRATVLMNFLAVQNETMAPIPKWREIQLLSFINLLNSFAFELKRAHEENRILTVTWLTRNLLELRTWVRYCNLSEETAKRFSDDSMRDFYGYTKALEKLCGATDTRDVNQLLIEFAGFAKRPGIDTLADDFIRVDKAAKELGEGNEFSAQYKIFSKLAHPTAFALNLSFSHATDETYRNVFLQDGVEYAIDALLGIRDFVITHHPAPLPEPW
jgi:hypothetical protein